MKWTFPHPYLEHLSLQVGPFTQIIGHNQELKYYLWQLLVWYFDGKKYKEEDLTLFQQVEPVIQKDSTPLKRNHYRFITISDISALLEQMVYKKGTVAFDYMKKKCNRVDVMTHLEEINNLLDMMSMQLNDILDLNMAGVNYHTESQYFTIDQLLSKNFLPYFKKDEQNIAFEFVENEKKVIIFLKMLCELLQDDTQPTLLLFKNMDDYLSYQSFLCVCQELEKMTNSFPYFQVMIFPSNEGYLYLTSELMSNVNIFGDFVAHLYEFDFLYERFAIQYPSNNVPTKEVFLQQLQKNASYLLTDQLEYISLSVTDLVMITILNRLYHYEKKIKYPIIVPDQLEVDYLRAEVDETVAKR
ncbi:CRISPR-associated protein Csn2-St [Streptococcus cameli]